MQLYRLFLLRDTTNNLTYSKYVGWALKVKDYYIRKVKLWDPLLKNYHKQTVRLAKVEVDRETIKVEVVN